MFFWNGGPSRLTDLVQTSLKKEASINEAAKAWTRSRLVGILRLTLKNDIANAVGVHEALFLLVSRIATDSQ